LIVDDESYILDALRRILVREGYQVLAARHPHEAVEAVRNSKDFDLVISDIRMPGMLGTHLIREVEAMSPRTARVLMTGGSDLRGVPDGVPVLKKPFSSRDLIAVVQESLLSRE
jgi:DNA-binding NtrC family response regulator